jgi:hypothetical protein
LVEVKYLILQFRNSQTELNDTNAKNYSIFKDYQKDLFDMKLENEKKSNEVDALDKMVKF